MQIPEILQRTDKDPAYKKEPVESVYEFRGVSPLETITVPQLAKNRKCTDVIFLAILIIASICLVISSAYVAAICDLRITINGRDKCENVCGIKNAISFSESCPAKDYTNYPILNVSGNVCIKEDECKAEDMVVFMGRCMSLTSNSTKNETGMDPEFWKSAEKWNPYTIIVCFVMVFVASVLALLVYYLYWHNIKYAIFGFSIGGTLIIIMGTFYLWFLISLGVLDFRRNHWDQFHLAVAICATLFLLLFACFLGCRGHRLFKLLIPFYRKSLGAIFVSKILLLVPIVSVVIGVVLLLCWIYMILAVISVPVPKDSFLAVHRIVYLVFLIAMGYWIFNFSNGCQCMTVAGIVASYYFSRNRAAMTSQYFKSLGIVFRFHLGTIACGSLIITIIQILRTLATIFDQKSTNQNQNAVVTQILSGIIHCILLCMEEIVNYITTKAYILTAIHGKSFIPSGKRAMRLIWTNFLDIISLDCMNALVHTFVSVIIMLISSFIGFAIISKEHSTFITINLLIGLFLVGITLYYFFSILGIALATIFICYCEDKSMNDGSRQRPYYMSEELENTINEAFEEAAKQKAMLTRIVPTDSSRNV